MLNKYSVRFKEIHSQVQKMNYSSHNIIELILLFKESIKIAKKISPHISKNPCLKNLLNTNDKEFKEMISKDINNEEDRKNVYNELKTNFLSDLSMNCIE